MKTTIVAFEGLSPWLIGTSHYLRNGLIGPLQVRQYKFDFILKHWFSRGFVWPKDGRLIVVAHSMGAAALQHIRELEREVDLFIGFDLRVCGQPYVKPENVREAHNFYQLGMWRGYPLEGADNTRVVGTRHADMPRIEIAHEILWKVLQ